MKKFSFSYLFYLLCSIIYLFPQFWSSKPNLADDPDSITLFIHFPFREFIAKSFTSHDRFRPLYDVYRYTLVFLFGDNIRFWFIFSAILLSLTLFLLAYILKSHKISEKASFILPFLLLIFPTTAEGYYRLGTAEPLQILLLLLLIICISRNKNSLLILFISLLFNLSKETSIFYLLPLILLIQNSRSKSIKLFFALLHISFICFYLFIFYPHRIGYVQYFSFTILEIPKHISSLMHAYPDMFLLYFLGIAWFLTLALQTKLPRTIYIYVLFSIFCLLPNFFWKFNYEYYFIPLVIFSVLFFALLWQETQIIIKRSNQLKNIARLYVIFTVVVFCLVLPSLISRSRIAIIRWHSDYILNGRLSEFLLSRKFKTVYFDYTDFEWTLKVQVLARHYDQYSLDFYPNSHEWIAIGGLDRTRLTTLSQKSRDLFLHKKSGTLITLNLKDLQYSNYTIIPLCKGSPFLEKTCRWHAVSWNEIKP